MVGSLILNINSHILEKVAETAPTLSVIEAIGLTLQVQDLIEAYSGLDQIPFLTDKLNRAEVSLHETLVTIIFDTEEVLRLLHNNKKLFAIKELRKLFPTISLGQAKRAVEDERVLNAAEGRTSPEFDLEPPF